MAHLHALDCPSTYTLCSESLEKLASEEDVTQVVITFHVQEERLNSRLISPENPINEIGFCSDTIFCACDFPTLMSDGYLENQVLRNFPSFQTCDYIRNEIRRLLSAYAREKAAEHSTRERPKKLTMNVNVGLVTSWEVQEEEELAAVTREFAWEQRGYCVVPASPASIETLKNGRLFQGSGDSTVCVVCMEEIGEGGEMVRMPCDHGFHEKCIVPWLQLNNSCPVCRTKLPDSLRMGSDFTFLGV